MVQTKQKKESSLSSVALSLFAAAILGLLIGFLFEVQRPPEFVQSRAAVQKNENSLSPTIRLGTRQTSDGWRQLFRKAGNTALGQSDIRLEESDLNGLAEQYLNFSLGKQQATQSGESPSYALFPETPNFAMDDDRLQIILPFEIVFFQWEASGFLVAVGHFSKDGQEPSFVVDEAWVNSARLPAFLAKFALSRLTKTVATQAANSPLAAAWSQIESIEVAGNEMLIEPR